MSVKVFTKVGLMKNEKWIKGIVLEEYENIFIVETYGNKISLEKRFVKPVLEMSYDDKTGFYPELSKFVDNNWDSLKNNILDAIKFFFPETKVSFNEEEKTVECEEFRLYVVATIKEIETISSFKECPAWEITITETIPATRHEPEDFSERVLSCESSTINTAKLFVDSIWNIKSGCYWDNRYYE
jgi:hypothetical protein